MDKTEKRKQKKMTQEKLKERWHLNFVMFYFLHQCNELENVARFTS